MDKELIDEIFTLNYKKTVELNIKIFNPQTHWSILINHGDGLSYPIKSNYDSS